MTSLRGAIPKEAGWVFCPNRGGDLTVKIGQNKSGQVTVQKCEESSHFLGDGPGPLSINEATKLSQNKKTRKNMKNDILVWLPYV